MARGFDLAISPDGTGPIFLRIARALTDDILRGRLRPGAKLPGSRTLARSLCVHRNTVLAAYEELAAEGWITTRRGQGTFVSLSLPERPPRRFAATARPRQVVPARPAYALAAPPETLEFPPAVPGGVLSLAAGLPDVRLAPVEALARAVRRILCTRSRSLLQYGDPRGDPRLRRSLATMLGATRGLAAGADEVLVARGSQMALYLTGRALFEPGDVVAVEDPGYRPAWEAFRAAGARVIPVPVDRDGLRVDMLDALTRKKKVRAVYVTPHHQHPATVMLAPGRRLELLDLAKAARIAVIEDDYDHEFHYDGRPVLPLASVDRAGTVVYIGTLTKVLAPGVRVGYIAAPEPLIARLAAIRVAIDRQGDRALEEAVADLIEDGTLARHVRRATHVYRARRDALAAALERELEDELTFEKPAGGLSIWATARPWIDGERVERWLERALEHRVAVVSGRRFAFDGRSCGRSFRLGFAARTEAEIDEAILRLRAAFPPPRGRAARRPSPR